MSKKIEDMNSSEIAKKLALSEIGIVVGSLVGGAGIGSTGMETCRNITDSLYNTPKDIVFTSAFLFVVGAAIALPSICSNINLELERTRRLMNKTW